MIHLTDKELDKLLKSFTHLKNDSNDTLLKEFGYLRRILDKSQDLDFFAKVCEQEHELNISIVELKDCILKAPLENRGSLKEELTLSEQQLSRVEFLRDQLNPMDDRNLRSAIHFINKNL